VVSFTPWPLYLRVKIPPLPIGFGGWVDPRAGLDAVKRRIFLTLPGLVVQSVASGYTDYAIPALSFLDGEILIKCVVTQVLKLFIPVSSRANKRSRIKFTTNTKPIKNIT
jgi:hypothetical protein